jgi:putative spermidine/putrescine transport system ATP-binding protein
VTRGSVAVPGIAAAGGGFESLRLDGVTRRFGAHAALDGLSLTIPRGEFVALLGPSGCGKSTALNCLAGLLPLSDGSIWLDDRRIDVLRPEQRGFGMVFQNYALFPHMTVRRNIGFGLAMRRIAKAEIARRVDRALALVQLAPHADKLPGQLSGGQQQRVAIARAIVIEPPLILMDEPLSNLDATLRLEMRTEIRRIHREVGRATVYVTHDQDEALSLADRIVVLQDGVVQQIGTPQALYERPTTLEVARFMGYRNLLELAVERVDGPLATVGGAALRLTGTRQGEVVDRVAVAIRPGEIAPVDPSADAPGEGTNRISGRVTNIEYCGRDYVVDMALADGKLLQFHSPLPLAPGATVTVGVPPARVLVFPR